MADLRNYWTKFHETWWSYRYMFLVGPKVFSFVVKRVTERKEKEEKEEKENNNNNNNKKRSKNNKSPKQSLGDLTTIRSRP
jgi:hypothetical protein